MASNFYCEKPSKNLSEMFGYYPRANVISTVIVQPVTISQRNAKRRAMVTYAMDICTMFSNSVDRMTFRLIKFVNLQYELILLFKFI